VRLRHALLALLLTLPLAGESPYAASPPVAHGSATATAGTNRAGTGGGVGRPAAGAAVTLPAAQETPGSDGRRDMTAFFTIGAIVDVLLVAAFLVWAVGQWRKAKK
jgi:hypothetical protein